MILVIKGNSLMEIEIVYSSRDLKHNLCWNRSYEVAFIMAIEHIKSRQDGEEQPVLCGCSPRFSHD